MNIRLAILTIAIVTGLLYVACGAPPEKDPARPGGAKAEKKAAEKAKTVRVRHLSGEILSVNAKTKTIIVRFREEDMSLQYDDSTIVKIDLDAVKPSDLPTGARANVKYVEKQGRYVARGIFVSTETAEKKESHPQSSYSNTAKAPGPPCRPAAEPGA